MRKFVSGHKYITSCLECSQWAGKEHPYCHLTKEVIPDFPEPTNCPLPDIEKIDLSWCKPLDADIQKAVDENFASLLME